MTAELTRSDFDRYFPHTPLALCIKECARLAVLRRENLEAPLLDVGCGDGLFASIAFPGLQSLGIDINDQEVALAAARGAYSRAITADITQAPPGAADFQSCLANCSLEHIPALDRALAHIFESLRPGGLFLTFVPQRDWTRDLISHQVLRALGARALADQLSAAVDAFFKHHHLYDEEGWREMVERAGFVVERIEPCLSSANTKAFEIFLLPSLLGWISKKLTNRYTHLPFLRRFFALPAYLLARTTLGLFDQTPTAEFFIVARRPSAASVS